MGFTVLAVMVIPISPTLPDQLSDLNLIKAVPIYLKPASFVQDQISDSDLTFEGYCWP